MSSAHLLRLQIESALASRIPSALTPAPRIIRPTAPTGIPALDEPLHGGFPIGALTELAGPESSGRTSLALSFLAGLTAAGRVCAWIDVSDSLDPESAASLGVDLDRLLWVRCGAEPRQLILPGLEDPRPADPLSPQPSAAPAAPAGAEPSRPGVPLSPATLAPRCAEPQPRRPRTPNPVPRPLPHPEPRAPHPAPCPPHPAPWSRLDQALRAADLLLQAGGFSALVLDMASIPAEYALRVPLATWYRYRAAVERTHASLLLLTRQACAKSSAGLVLQLSSGPCSDQGGAILTAAEYRVEVLRERFTPAGASVSPAGRKPPQSERSLRWQSSAPWTGNPAGRQGGRP